MSQPLTVAILLKLIDRMSDPMKVAVAGSSKSLDDLGNKSESTGKRVAASANYGATAVKALVGAFSAYKVMDLIRDSALLSARFETMGVVMGVAGNNAGYTRVEMASLEKQMQATGISMIKSREVLTSLATANIDLAQATGLARAAQDLAVVGNLNSSDALARMVQGIKSGEVEILKTLGLNVSFEASYKKMAASLGINTTALTEQQKVQARTDAVMAGSAAYAGIYGESLTTAGKAMLSLTRYWENFKLQAGDALLPALSDAVFQLTDALKAANAELDKAGSAGTIDSIGNGLATAFRTAYEVVVVWGASMVATFAVVGRAIGGYVAQVNAMLHLDFAGAKFIGAEMKKDATAAVLALDAFIVKMGNHSQKTAAAAKTSEAQRIAAGEAARKSAADEAAAAAVVAAATEAKARAGKAAAAAYSHAIKASQDYIAQIQKETATIGMSDAQQAMYNAENIARTMSLAGVREKAILAFLNQSAREISAREQAAAKWGAFDREFEEAIKGQTAMVEKFDAARKSYIDGLVSAADAAAKQVETMILEAEAAALSETSNISLAEAIELVTIKRLDDALATAQMAGNNAAVEAIQREIDKRRELAGLIGQKEAADALKDLDAYLNPAKAKSFGDALANSFGKAGTAIGKMAGAFDNYAQKQAEFDKKKAEFDKNKEKFSPADRIKKETELTKKQSEIQIDAYADMAGAAKTFFDEGSTGYKVLSAAEQGFRLLQMGMSIAAIAQGWVESGQTVQQKMLEAQWSTTAGVAKAFSQMGVFGFIGAAAIIAFMASMGVRGGGGGSSVSMSAMRQEKQGTGTVLGDPSAKSNSLANSLDLLADVNTLTMHYSALMAKSLQNIEKALTGVSSMIFRTPGLTSGNMSGIAESSYKSGWGSTKGLSSEAFSGGLPGFSSKKVSLTDSGLYYKGALKGIEDGLQMFSEITTKKSSWWGLKKSSKTNTVMDDAPDDVSRQFGLIFEGISDSLEAAGGMFGKSADILETQIANIEIDLGMVSLKGLKGDELKDALGAVISATADDIAREVLPGLEKYIKVGEGYYETAIRVAYSTEAAQAALMMIGKGFTGAAMEIVDFSQVLIDAFGGLEELTDGLVTYFETFYSQQEQFAYATATLADGFDSLGTKMPKTSREFRELIGSIDTTTEAGADLFAGLIKLAPAFDNVIGEIERLITSVNGMFTDTIENIRLSVMSDEQQYNYWRTKIDTDMAALMIATDPYEIARLSGNINTGMNNAYGLLDETQQQALAPDFIDYAADANTIATDRLNAAPDNILIDNLDTLAEVIKNSITDAAAVMLLAAQTQLAAANMPVKVDVDVTVNTDGTSVEVGG